MKLTGPQMSQIQAALLDAFPNVGDLEQMVAFQLGEQISHIAAGSNYRELIFHLIKWAIAHDRIYALLSGACLHNPDNQALRIVTQQLEANGSENAGELPTVFRALVADKTEGFVGRDYVFDAIELFTRMQSSGYFTIQGDPGAGKSSILAEYVRRTGCVAYFNVRAQGITNAAQFLEGICTQLIARYSLPYISLPAGATRDGMFFAQLLGEIAAKLSSGDRLVIAVDALDEVDFSGQLLGTNVLYLPSVLPKGVYFVVTRRDVLDQLPWFVQAPQNILDLLQFSEQSSQDVREYIRRMAALPAVQTWVARQRDSVEPLTIEEFIRILGDRSENNFMYVRHVLADIEHGFYEDLQVDHLPIGLKGYYEDHWHRMGMLTHPLPAAKIRIVYVLSEVKQPVSRQLIAHFARQDEYQVQQVLNEWNQFLHKQLADVQVRYSVYHASFREFLHRKDIVQAAGVTIPEIHTLIADVLWNDLFAPGESD